jgi:hypothetical protein
MTCLSSTESEVFSELHTFLSLLFILLLILSITHLVAIYSLLQAQHTISNFKARIDELVHLQHAEVFYQAKSVAFAQKAKQKAKQHNGSHRLLDRPAPDN